MKSIAKCKKSNHGNIIPRGPVAVYIEAIERKYCLGFVGGCIEGCAGFIDTFWVIKSKISHSRDDWRPDFMLGHVHRAGSMLATRKEINGWS
jgi:hypothetical protein